MIFILKLIKIKQFLFIVSVIILNQIQCIEGVNTMTFSHSKSSDPLESKQFFSKQALTEEAAERVEKVAIEKAKELGIKISIAIVDESGTLQRFLRMDGARLRVSILR